jgi:large-conductance mechanosensitive channel
VVFKADDLAKFMVGPFKVGALIGAAIDFLLIALVVYVVFVRGLKRVVPDTSKPA